MAAVAVEDSAATEIVMIRTMAIPLRLGMMGPEMSRVVMQRPFPQIPQENYSLFAMKFIMSQNNFTDKMERKFEQMELWEHAE